MGADATALSTLGHAHCLQIEAPLVVPLKDQAAGKAVASGSLFPPSWERTASVGFSAFDGPTSSAPYIARPLARSEVLERFLLERQLLCLGRPFVLRCLPTRSHGSFLIEGAERGAISFPC